MFYTFIHLLIVIKLSLSFNSIHISCLFSSFPPPSLPSFAILLEAPAGIWYASVIFKKLCLNTKTSFADLWSNYHDFREKERNTSSNKGRSFPGGVWTSHDNLSGPLDTPSSSFFKRTVQIGAIICFCVQLPIVCIGFALIYGKLLHGRPTCHE